MKLIHTSDWHLGRTLYGRKRYEEFSAFLDWLLATIEQEGIDALLIAGDVFDTTTPSNRAQQLYYRFLCRVADSCCQHVVIIAGNHDSPSFLDAPKELLQTLNVHVVGMITKHLDDEIIILSQKNQEKAIICAVPYLRDKDIRSMSPGENIDEKNAKLIAGLKKHYTEVCALAERKRLNSGKNIPIIGMGHLFAAGAKTVDGDGVRELYVGSLAHVGKDLFPESIDYLALGHLHVPQCVAGAQHMRYSGSPIPMGFGEATQEKQILLIEFKTNTPTIKPIPVPCFQALVRLGGTLETVLDEITRLKQTKSDAWLEIEYTGREVIANLREMLDETVIDSAMEILRIKNRRVIDQVIGTIAEDETLDSLSAQDVFIRCLETFEVPDEDREDLTNSHDEIIKSLHEEDVNAK